MTRGLGKPNREDVKNLTDYARGTIDKAEYARRADAAARTQEVSEPSRFRLEFDPGISLITPETWNQASRLGIFAPSFSRVRHLNLRGRMRLGGNAESCE
ncbi:hypothetical protein [Mycetocola sp. JXN-3]|uniref:antitoxin VbhA family protein n=1 Tax=Mycetocola sp. JXN-3 TaxID=2116510 RepID=UPI002107003F|nr:hypothetical protein [Mycetocola sp. JXN-3]